jgi:hypothetical protein
MVLLLLRMISTFFDVQTVSGLTDVCLWHIAANLECPRNGPIRGKADVFCSDGALPGLTTQTGHAHKQLHAEMAISENVQVVPLHYLLRLTVLAG